MKQCFKCGEEKPLSGFYRHPRMSDGRLGKCKTCTKRDVRANRKKKSDYYREYDRSRNMRPDRVEARLAYQKTEAGREAVRRAHKNSQMRYPNAHKAVTALGNAVRDGKVKKPKSCEACGRGGIIHGHHDDYNKPLEVRWLCQACHRQWHVEYGPGENADAPIE